MTFPTYYHIGLIDLLVFLGVAQGIILSWFFIRSRHQNKANLFQGLFLLVLSLAIFEELLNNTGYIVDFLFLSNFTEPLSYTFGPLFFIYIKRSLKPELSRSDWWHFLIALFWLGYMMFFFLQPDAAKYNSFLYSKHPEITPLSIDWKFSDDPLNLKHYTNLALSCHFSLYMILAFLFLRKQCNKMGQSIFRPENIVIKRLRNGIFHIGMIILIFIFTKIYFGRDLGDDFIAAYISLMIFLTGFAILRGSDYFNQPHSILDFPTLKYQKSSLDEDYKVAIAAKITKEMTENNYYTSNMASVSDLAKRVHESTHHVSQVINEQLKMSFFELLAWYRVEEAKKMLREDHAMKLTIEELAEEVGYNSKTAFNNAFKKLTGKTPSEFRRSL